MFSTKPEKVNVTSCCEWVRLGVRLPCESYEQFNPTVTRVLDIFTSVGQSRPLDGNMTVPV